MISNQADDRPPRSELMDAWFTPGRFAGLLGGLIFLTFFNVIAGQETFFHRDFGVFTYPVARYYRECFWRGELPLWNPLSYCGIPFLAQWNTSVLYPPSLFYLVLPLSWSLGVFNVGHLFVAGMGMYFLARRWMGNNFAASVAGLAFAYSGLSWQLLTWISNLAAWAWMPWVVLLVERAWREGGRRIVIAAVVGAIQILSGAPEIILLTWLFCGALWAGQAIRGTVPFWTTLKRNLATGLLVGGLSAAQLLPFLDLLKHSHRDANYGDAGWSMPVSGLGNFLEPLFHCFEGGHGVFAQYDQYWTASVYLGAGTLLLASVALWRVRNGRVRLLAAAAAFGVLMALGKRGLIYTIIKAVLPQLGFMRYPIKFVALTAFVLPLLAGYAVRWNQEAPVGAAQKRKSLQVVLALLLTLLAVIVGLEWIYPLPRDNWPMTWHNALARAVFLVLTTGAMIGLGSAAKAKTQLLLRVALLLLLWLDVFTLGYDPNPTASRSVFEPGIIRQSLGLAPQPRGDEPRMMQTAEAADRVRLTYLSKPEADYLCRRLALYSNCNLLDDIPKIDGFYSTYLREMARILRLVYDYDARNIDLNGLKDFLGVARISATGASKTKELEWVNRTNYLPLVTAGQKPYFLPETNILAHLTKPEFDAREMVFLPQEASGQVTATNRTDAKITAAQIAVQRLDIEVTASAPSMVVIAQGFYHPWHAYVDGKATELLRANYAFQALQVPAGKHQVSLIYQDNVFRLGVAISAGALLICVAMWFWPRANRQSSTSAS